MAIDYGISYLTKRQKCYLISANYYRFVMGNRLTIKDDPRNHIIINGMYDCLLHFDVFGKKLSNYIEHNQILCDKEVISDNLISDSFFEALDFPATYFIFKAIQTISIKEKEKVYHRLNLPLECISHTERLDNIIIFCDLNTFNYQGEYSYPQFLITRENKQPNPTNVPTRLTIPNIRQDIGKIFQAYQKAKIDKKKLHIPLDNQDNLQWILSYLNEKLKNNQLYESIKLDIEQINNDNFVYIVLENLFIDSTSYEEFKFRQNELIQQINKAFSQKKFRDSKKNEKPLNIFLKKTTKEKLIKMANTRDKKLHEMIEELIIKASIT